MQVPSHRINASLWSWIGHLSWSGSVFKTLSVTYRTRSNPPLLSESVYESWPRFILHTYSGSDESVSWTHWNESCLDVFSQNRTFPVFSMHVVVVCVNKGVKIALFLNMDIKAKYYITLNCNNLLLLFKLEVAHLGQNCN